MPEQGETYYKFIEGELKAEYERRTTLTSSATAVVSASTAFVALVSSILVFVTGKDYAFSASGAKGLLFSLASFIVAAILALIAAASREYEVPTADTLKEMTSTHWVDDEVDARNVCAALNATTLGSLRTGSNKKAGVLVAALVFQLAAVIGIVITVGWELRGQIL